MGAPFFRLYDDVEADSIFFVDGLLEMGGLMTDGGLLADSFRGFMAGRTGSLGLGMRLAEVGLRGAGGLGVIFSLLLLYI